MRVARAEIRPERLHGGDRRKGTAYEEAPEAGGDHLRRAHDRTVEDPLAGPASARRRMVPGATVLTLANTAAEPSEANTPSAPRQTSSTAASSAARPAQRPLPPLPLRASRLGRRRPQRARLHRWGVRFQTVTRWPFSSALNAKASPMFPVPTMAILTLASVSVHP